MENVSSELKRRSQRRNSFYPAKTWLPNAKMRLPNEKVASKGKKGRKRVSGPQTSLPKAKTRSPNGNVARKGENVFSERKCRSQRRKGFYPAKASLPNAKRRNRAQTSIAKAKTRIPSENVAHKGEKAFVQRKRRSQT